MIVKQTNKDNSIVFLDIQIGHEDGKLKEK